MDAVPDTALSKQRDSYVNRYVPIKKIALRKEKSLAAVAARYLSPGGRSNDMLFGDLYARRLIEKMCGIEIVDADAGFGFLE